jgi:hypothetical protein
MLWLYEIFLFFGGDFERISDSSKNVYVFESTESRASSPGMRHAFLSLAIDITHQLEQCRRRLQKQT